MLRAGAATYQSLEGLTSATFVNSGTLISLAQVATLRPGFDFSKIRRRNQARTIIVGGRSATLTAGDLLNLIQPGGYHIHFSGELEKSAETNGKLTAGIPAAPGVMVIAIIIQFNSFRRTLLIFMTIPPILVGIPFDLP